MADPTGRSPFIIKQTPPYCDMRPLNFENRQGMGVRVISAAQPTQALAWLGREYPSTRLRNEEAYLNIKRRNFSTGSAGDCGARGTTRIIPLSPTNQAEPYANYGLEITATVLYTQTDGSGDKFETCQASTTLKPDGDNAPPTLRPQVLGDFKYVSTGTNLAEDRTPLRLPISCDSGNVRATVEAQESGVVFACSIVRASGTPANAIPPDNKFVDCRDSLALFADAAMFPLTATRPTATMVVVPPVDTSPQTTVRFSFTDLPEGWYTLYVRAFDTAQNFSTGTIVFGVDLTRPGAGRLNEPPGLMLGLDQQGLATRIRGVLIRLVFLVYFSAWRQAGPGRIAQTQEYKCQRLVRPLRLAVQGRYGMATELLRHFP